MGRRREESKPDRFLNLRSGIYQYVRRVPSEVAAFDSRAPMIRKSLKTSDLAKAMALRDIHERADNEFWASLIVGDDKEVAQRRYKASVARATALGYTYRSAADIASVEPSAAIVERVEKAVSVPKSTPDRDALLGMAEGGDQTISAAIETFISVIARDEVRFKSKRQRRRWESLKRSSAAEFTEQCGDKRMNDITREDAHKFYNFWMDRIAPKTGAATHSASLGNRHLGNLRGLYRDWFAYHGQKDVKNPFDGLSYVERRRRSKRKRPPFSVEWIKNKLLAPNALEKLNAEARGILLAMVETGARPSEICNLKPENIVLNATIPHINIEPSFDPDEPREIKTDTSIRQVPLVGVSLAAMKKHSKGFPRYADKGDGLSATVNKFLREHGLLETPKHSAYSLRHSMEDRMKDAHFSDDMRREILGHSIDRPDYGTGFSLKRKQEELKRIALPLDPVIL